MPRLASQEVVIDGTRISCHSIDVNSNTELIPIFYQYKANPDWVHTDSKHHRHSPVVRTDALGQRHVVDYPTLAEVYAEPFWCEDCQEVHDRYVDHLECIKCGETVKPGILGPGGEEKVEGPTEITIRLRTFVLPNVNVLSRRIGQPGLPIMIGDQHYVTALTQIDYSSDAYSLTFVVTEPPDG